MANTILHKRSATPADVPTTGQLALGEIGINTYDGKIYIKKDDGAPAIVEIGATGPAGADATPTAQLIYAWDGGGAVLPTGLTGMGLPVAFDCTILEATLFADQTGSVVVDIWKDTYANYPPTVADTIVASAKPTLSSARKSVDATLTGWTTTVTAGDVLFFNIDSVSTITALQLVLKVQKT